MTIALEPTTSMRRLRHDLAAAFRLADRFGFSEGICNHFSAAAPVEPEAHLINPLGLHWSEIGANDLLLITASRSVASRSRSRSTICTTSSGPAVSRSWRSPRGCRCG